MTAPHVPFRTVLYTNDFEPITVLELSTFAREFLERHGRVRLSVPTTAPALQAMRDLQPELNSGIRIVCIWMETFLRKGQIHTILFTEDDENALLLKAAFLPGQHRAVQEQSAKAFAEGFLRALTEIGQLRS